MNLYYVTIVSCTFIVYILEYIYKYICNERRLNFDNVECHPDGFKVRDKY